MVQIRCYNTPGGCDREATHLAVPWGLNPEKLETRNLCELHAKDYEKAVSWDVLKPGDFMVKVVE